MREILIAAVAILAAFFAPRVIPDSFVGWRRAGAIAAFRLAFGLVALYEVLSTSIIQVPADQVGLVRKVYGLKNLEDGHIIATRGETGYQAEVIPPGTFRISIFFNVLNRVDLLPIIVVPNGFYGRIVANDGQGLGAGQIMADAWPEGDQAKFLDAEYFMTHGGEKGLQLSILKPGIYPLNLALFQVKIEAISGMDATSRRIATTFTICAGTAWSNRRSTRRSRACRQARSASYARRSRPRESIATRVRPRPKKAA